MNKVKSDICCRNRKIVKLYFLNNVIFKYSTSITMKKIITILIFFLLAQTYINAQNEKDRAYILRHTNVQELKKISEKSNDHYTRNLKKAENQSVEKEIINDKNEIGYLSGFDIDGNPEYDYDDNAIVAKSSRIDQIWVGGASGLDLDGSGIEIGQWEGAGVPLITHNEFDGHVTHGEISPVSSHSTHTSGTMIGVGALDYAKGMASNATVVSRRSNNDETEIAEFAAAGGILSNHSYSTGDPNGEITYYGRYTLNSKVWDDIMYNAPYLTMCKSASNDRDDGVNTGDMGYDLIYSLGICKNLITVGAVEDVHDYLGPQSVIQSSFSSWGPTDDWRIKPDLTANGVSVYSADNDNDSHYSIKNGTSMSTPAVTGTVALLQQHYHNGNGVYMKSATVKALLLGTTDEAGAHDGPDFQSGWGLLNAERAADVISNNGSTSLIDELSLENGSTYTTTIEIDGNSPLALTIAWTDPSGPVLYGTDNKTPRLINDLDVRISNGDTTYEPWVLAPNITSNNFTDAATKGDNFRDNIERIDVGNLPPDIYTITVSHKGNLVNGVQDFSLMVNGLAESSLSSTDLEDLNDLISIYPNPSDDGYFNVFVADGNNSAGCRVQVYDLLGRTVKNDVFYGNQMNLDLSEMDSGLFIVKIGIDKGDVVRFISIQ